MLDALLAGPYAKQYATAKNTRSRSHNPGLYQVVRMARSPLTHRCLKTRTCCSRLAASQLPRKNLRRSRSEHKNDQRSNSRLQWIRALHCRHHLRRHRLPRRLHNLFRRRRHRLLRQPWTRSQCSQFRQSPRRAKTRDRAIILSSKVFRFNNFRPI